MCWGGGFKAGREMRGQRLIWDSGRERGNCKKKKKKSKALGMNMCVGEKRYTAGQPEKESQPEGRQIDSSPESHNKHVLFLSA